MPIFKFNENSGELELNVLEIKTVPAFNAIYKRDKGGVIYGDYDGRRKFLALKEFSLVWYLASQDSPALERGLSEKEALIKAIQLFELPSDYVIDNIIKDAIIIYKEHFNYSTPAVENSFKLIKTFTLSGKSIDIVNERLENLLFTLSNTRLIDNTDESSNISMLQNIKEVQGLIDWAINISSRLPDDIKKMKELKKLAEIEKSEKRYSKGGKEIGNRADPKRF